ncbi:ribonuclease YeeF family protein [Sporolactobacillus terrae]|uniref:ribonuclease YeeF family protein n=1 Tax=Sporolactobacillus terrae TaxID=269673 RepID=UPI00048C5869|nr:T7SS effector LXG polymorphic toxin [Sporolactobacillus terrae]
MRVNIGGSSSAGDTQTYDAESLITAAKAHAKHYQTLRDQFHNLRTAFQQIAGLGPEFQGKGADAIKHFYSGQINVVDAWLRLIDKKIAYFQGVSGSIEDKNLGGGTEIHVPFLNEELSMSYARSKEMVREQRDDIAKILSNISDLVPINVFSNYDVDHALDAADKKRAQTTRDVQDLDQSLTNEYRQISEDLPHIQALYEALIHVTRQGADVQPMHFNATAYHDSKIYQVQDEMQKETQKYLEIKTQQEQARHVSKKDTQPVNPLLANATKAAIMDQEIQYGLRDGAKDAVKDTVLGLWESATHPVETLKGTWHAATHPIQTANLIKNALVQSFDKEMVHGNAYTRTRWVTYAITTLATSVVGTKGIDKISKVAKAGKMGEAASKVRNTIKTTRTKSTAWVNQKLDQWSSPPLPRTQFADGPVPYNVIDSKRLRNKLDQLPDRTAPLPNQNDQVRDLIQQASAKKVDGLKSSEKTSQSSIVPKLSNLSLDEQIKLADQYKQKAPIEIPDDAKIKAQSKSTGYEQISYKWSEDHYKYEARWHTRTPGAPKNQGNTWVIQRTVPGNGSNKPRTFFKIDVDEWIAATEWYAAISARKANKATKDQINLLNKGHWKG